MQQLPDDRLKEASNLGFTLNQRSTLITKLHIIVDGKEQPYILQLCGGQVVILNMEGVQQFSASIPIQPTQALVIMNLLFAHDATRKLRCWKVDLINQQFQLEEIIIAEFASVLTLQTQLIPSIARGSSNIEAQEGSMP
jgi:hypothetical protein